MTRAANVVFWVRRLSLLVLSALFLLYASRAVDKYREGKVATAVTQESVSGFEYPTFVICASENGDYGDLRRAAQQPAWIQEVGAVFRGERDYQFYYPDRRENGNASANFRHVPHSVLVTRHANLTCDYVSLAENISYGFSHDLHLNLVDSIPPRVLLMVHHGSVVLPPFSLFGSAILYVSVRDEQRTRIYYALDFGSMRRLPTGERPCVEDTTSEAEMRSMRSCFDDYVRSRVPCFSSGDVSNCDDEEQKKVEEMTDGLFEKGEYEFLRETGCQIPCEIPTYTVTMQSEFPLVRSRYNDSSTMARMARLSLRFHAPKSQFTRKKQYVVYDWDDLGGDLGGMGGILLGFSCLAAFEQAARGAAAAAAKKKRKGKAKMAESAKK